jgi:hypothetical protein
MSKMGFCVRMHQEDASQLLASPETKNSEREEENVELFLGVLLKVSQGARQALS